MESDVVAAEEAADAVDEEVEGQFHGRVGSVLFGDLAEVRGPGQGFPAGFFVEDFFGARDVQCPRGSRGELADIRGVVEDETGSSVRKLGFDERLAYTINERKEIEGRRGLPRIYASAPRCAG